MSKAKQVMMRPKKDIHYFEKQKKHIVNFIIRGSDVEVTVMFRKEEIPSQTEFGLDLLNLLADELSEIATVEAQPTLYGRNMTMIIKPGVSKALGDSDRNVRKSAAEVFHEIGDHAFFEVHKAAAGEGNAEIGIVFDIDELGGGFYGLTAYKVLFQSLDPNLLKGCTLRDGDTTETLAGRARHYCIAFQSTDSATVQYIRDTLAHSQESGLLPEGRRFIEATSRQPLVLAGVIDSNGSLVVKEGSMIGPGWVEGTAWAVLTR